MLRDEYGRYPILLGELRALNIVMRIHCVLCGNGRDFTPHEIKAPNDATLDDLVDRARCTVCNRRRGGISITIDWKPWIRHLKATRQLERIPPFGRMMSDD